MTASRLLAKLIRRGARELRQSLEELPSWKDPEVLHAFRVSLRRLRTALRLSRDLLPIAADARLDAELRRMSRATGPVRNWDLLLAVPVHNLAHRFPGRSTRSLLAVAQASRVRARAQCLAVLSRPQVAAALAQLDQVGERVAAQPGLRRFARKALQRQHDKVRKDLRRLTTLDAGGAHHLRVRAKRLRYTAEFFAECFPAKAARAYAAVLREVQNQLGARQDAAIFSRLASGPALKRADALARGRLQGWCAAHADCQQRNMLAKLGQQPRLRSFWD